MFFNLKRKDLYTSKSIFRPIMMNFNDAFIARTRDSSGIARKYIPGDAAKSRSRQLQQIRKEGSKEFKSISERRSIQDQSPDRT